MGPVGCADESTQPNNAVPVEQKTATPAAQSSAGSSPTTASRDALLEIAFQIGTSIPTEPHARDRARMQALVAQTCLDNGSLDQAIKYASKIDGWRQGEMFALIGQRYATMNDPQHARDFAARAIEVAAGETDWRHERVITESAKLYVQLGDTAKAYELVQGATQAELGKIEVARTVTMLPAQLDTQADMFDKAIATKNFDLVRGAIDGYMAWLDRVSDDEIRSNRALKAIDNAIPGLPLDLQVKCEIDLADLLYKNHHTDLALVKLHSATEIFSSTTFLPEDVAPLGALVARAHQRMGDTQGARQQLQKLHSEHSTRRDGIVDLRRATSLRALAEGFCELGDRDEAIACYAAALEEGAINPNARPRAEDLCATCISMAKYGILPTSDLMRRIDSIRNSLTDPW